MAISDFSILIRACANFTSPDSFIDNKLASVITPKKEGNIRISRLEIVTLFSKKIIKVVTSPVISETPPLFTENMISVAYFNRFFTSNCRFITTAIDTKVAVTLSAKEENTKAKIAMTNIKPRSDILSGNIRCTSAEIKPLLFK